MSIDEKDRIFADNLYKYIKECKINGIESLKEFPDLKDIQQTINFTDTKLSGFRFELSMRVLRNE